MIKDLCGKKQDGQRQTDKDNRVIDENLVRPEACKIEPDEQPFEKEEETWNLKCR